MFEVLKGDASTGSSSAPAAEPRAPRPPSPDRESLVPNRTIEIALGVTAALAVAGVGFTLGRMTATAGGDVAASGIPLLPEVSDLSTADARTPRVPTPSQAAIAPSARIDTTPSAVIDEVPPRPNAFAGRKVGQNYLLIQSYDPNLEREGAEATVEALKKAGIDATIETNIPGWRTRLSVVGTEPFARQSNNPAYDAYLRRVMKVSDEAKKHPKVRRFAPTLVKWGR
jgi:hypothetical protein